MGRFVGIHTVPGFTPQMLEGATEQLNQFEDARFVRAYTSFGAGKVVCDWEAAGKDAVAKAYAAMDFPYDEIVPVEAICEQGSVGVDTRFL